MASPVDKGRLRYEARRAWQDEVRSRGEVPECGREACQQPASPAWTNKGTPLLYCPSCARLINRYNPGLCTPEQVPLVP